MSYTKKKIIIPFAMLALGMCILVSIVYGMESSQKKQNITKAELNAMTYAERMKIDVREGIGVTDTLQQILISENGRIERFDKVAENMMTDSIQSVQIAPDGVVTEIYPQEGNEAGKIDLIHDKDRWEISCYARDNHPHQVAQQHSFFPDSVLYTDPPVHQSPVDYIYQSGYLLLQVF